MCLRHEYLMHISYVPCVCVRSLVKTEPTIKETPNIQEILLNMRTSLSQNFNAVACFILELLRRLHYPKNCEGAL